MSEEKEWVSYQDKSLKKRYRKSYFKRKKVIASHVREDDVVLDVGSYDNAQLKYLKLKDKSQYFPIDIHQFTPETIVVDILKDKLPFEDEKFDKIVFSMVLEHLDQPKTALLELKRVLKKDGELIVIVPNSENVVKIIQSILFEKKLLKATSPEHCLGFGTEEIANLLKRVNMRITHFKKRSPEIASFNLLLPDWGVCKPFTSDILAIAKKR